MIYVSYNDLILKRDVFEKDQGFYLFSVIFNLFFIDQF